MWNFNQYSDNVALLSDDGITVTYSMLMKECKKLREIISEKSLVFCMCSNTVGSVISYVASIENEIVPILLNESVEGELYKALLETYKPNYIFRKKSETNDRDSVCLEFYNYELIKWSDYKHSFNDDLALLLTTSGSTGSPKFVRQSYENIKVNAEQIVEYLGLRSDERAITTLPMNYTYGLSIINSHLLVGATILLTDKGLMQREFWQFFKESKATSFGGVPYTYEMLYKLRFMRMDLPYLRYMTQAGGKLSPELHKEFATYADKTGKKFIVMYGQCEATARMSYLPGNVSIEKCGFVGVPVPGGRFELIDIDGETITESNTPGELVYYGKNVTLGYANSPDDFILGDERHGRLETGDIALVDEEGYYKIVGRKKRFLKVYGNRVNLDELNGLIKRKYENIEAVCAGYDDHVYVFIENSGGIPDLTDNIIKYLSSKTKLNPSAFTIRKINSIPRNDSGKILYKELEHYYEL